MSLKPSHITVEVPLDHGGTLTLRARYSVFLKEGLAAMKESGASPPMSDEDILKILDIVISHCAKGAAKASINVNDEKKEDKW